MEEWGVENRGVESSNEGVGSRNGVVGSER